MVPITNWGRLGNQMFMLAYIVGQKQRGEVPDIWVQDPKYFENAADEVKSMFRDGIIRSNHVSIHVRRTDYLKDPMFGNLGATDYYERAIALFPDATFLVFSDDIEWCFQKWGDDHRFEFAHGTELEDMNRMAGCRHNIIANSSFSWWAAWLNPTRGRRVIYPKLWHTDGVQRIQFPESWESL